MAVSPANFSRLVCLVLSVGRILDIFYVCFVLVLSVIPTQIPYEVHYQLPHKNMVQEAKLGGTPVFPNSHTCHIPGQINEYRSNNCVGDTDLPVAGD